MLIVEASKLDIFAKRLDSFFQLDSIVLEIQDYFGQKICNDVSYFKPI